MSNHHWASLSAGARKIRWSGAIWRGELTGGTGPRENSRRPRIGNPDRDQAAYQGSMHREVHSISNFHCFEVWTPTTLVADRELDQNAFVTLRAAVFDVCQQPAALRYKAQQASPRRMIFFMCLKVFRQLSDTRAQKRDLHFRRPGVGLVDLVPGYDLPFCFSRQCHLKGCYSCSSLYSFVSMQV